MEEKEKELMLGILKRHGIIKFTAEFSGGGDSGDVNGVSCDGLVSEPSKFDWPKEWDHGCWRGQDTFEDFLYCIAGELLECTGYDWVNNEGGYGELIIVPGHDYIHIDMNINGMTSEHIPCDLSLPSAGDYDHLPAPETTQQSNGSKPLLAVLVSLASNGTITPAHLDAFRTMETEAGFYRLQAAHDTNRYQALQAMTPEAREFWAEINRRADLIANQKLVPNG